ncbi:aromatic ring-hydroxylating dioxygenase subunit alpha [Azospirillum sp. 412522]|nr:aromatic ring-hydroxylating dioxygenase subunit alpha [Azospirillum sp. 412522]MBY6262797.1 aromatic ring-hydroxylating dioxygenase subunit alpha [Azospirillum sp. 412522]
MARAAKREEPVSDAKPFPMNSWYAAAWGHEIGRALTPRTICGKDIVLYRRTTGEVAALEDACWHRLLPLSLGRLDGDQVVCGYHGLVFDAGGRCTHMPAQETINPSACVRSFPVVERHRLVWAWMGDPALADPGRIPDFHWNDGTDWVGEGGTFYSLKCDYRLVTDNLMDLTHETYVHAGSIGDDAITRTPFEVTHTDRTATVERWMEDIEPPPFWARQLASTGRSGRVDRWQIILFQAPSTIVGDVGVALTGTGARAGDRSQGVNGCFLAAITPESETSCHYFWNFVRTYRIDDAELTKQLNLAHVNGGRGVYDQDHAVLEAQQKAIDRNRRQPFYNLNIDAGALWARRLIDGMIAAENGAAPQPRMAAE